MSSSKQSSSYRWVSWGFGFALILALILFVNSYSQQKEFLQLIDKAQPAWLIMATLAQILTYVFQAGVWQIALLHENYRMSIPLLMRLSLCKLFMDQAMPAAGVTGTFVVIKALQSRQVSSKAVASLVVINFLTFYSAYACALILALIFIFNHPGVDLWIFIVTSVFLGFTLGAALFFLLIAQGNPWLLRLIARIKWLQKATRLFANEHLSIVHHMDRLLLATGFQIMIFILDGATIWALLLALGVHGSFWGVFASFMISAASRTMSIIPGGLGIFEAVSVGTLKVMGIPLAASLASTLLFRGLSFWLPMIPGLIFAHRETVGARRGTVHRAPTDPNRV